MNNLSYYLARLYYAAAHQSIISSVPSGFSEEFWSERLYRLIAGFPDNISGGKNTSFWLELLFYKKTNQTHRLATGTYPAWFWLSKLYAFYSGQSTDAIFQPANAAFWAEKLVSLLTFEAPEISVTVNAVSQADNSTFTPSNPIQGTPVQYTVTATNNGVANLTLTNATRSGAVTAATVWLPSAILIPGASATCTITLDTASSGAKTGYFEFTTNDFTGGEDTYRVNAGYSVLAPIMEVYGNGVLITNGDGSPASGDHTDFGATDAGTTVSYTYTIQNTGDTALTGVSVSVPTGFTLTSAPAGTIAASGSSTFTVRLDASATGTKSGNITIDSAELADYVFAISGIVRTYVQKLVAQVPIQLLALSETSGTNADDSGAGNLDGVYNGGIALNATTFTDGTPAPLFDGVDDYVAASSAGLASVFSLSAGTLSVWWKMDADKWEDLLFHFFAGMTVDINNRFQILKDTGSKTLRCDWVYGGLIKTVTYVIPVTPTGWVHIAATYTGGTLRLYLNGVEVGTAATGGGSMTGTLTAANIGRHFSSTFYAPGNAKYRGYWNTGLSAAEILRQVAVP